MYHMKISTKILIARLLHGVCGGALIFFGLSHFKNNTTFSSVLFFLVTNTLFLIYFFPKTNRLFSVLTSTAFLATLTAYLFFDSNQSCFGVCYNGGEVVALFLIMAYVAILFLVETWYLTKVSYLTDSQF